MSNNAEKRLQIPESVQLDAVMMLIGDHNGCWIWPGKLFHNGYGMHYSNGHTYRAHRVIYTYFKGPIPAELEIDHTCGVRACVNPMHLEAVTSSENTRRADDFLLKEKP